MIIVWNLKHLNIHQYIICPKIKEDKYMNELTQEQRDAIQAMAEAFNKIYEAAKKLIEELIFIAKQYIPLINMLYSKHMMIYNRTKSKRIRKKQLSMLGKKVLI
jgi:hypothetical protein